MARCQGSDLNELHSGFEKCQTEASLKVWCPTWIGAEKGPMRFCAKHAENFTEKNPHANINAFYWGEEADKAYAEWMQQDPKTRPHFNYEHWGMFPV